MHRGSNLLLVAGFRRRFAWCCSVPLFYHYEAVPSRADLLLAAGLGRTEVAAVTTDLAGTLTRVRLQVLRRPQLRGPNHEMVLEATANGRADAIVTHNVRDFGDAPGRFGVAVRTPGELMERIGT